MPRRVLFHRDYRGFTGGHLKVFDYFNHIKSSDQYQAQIYLTPSSAHNHLWHKEQAVIDFYDPGQADILFVAGMDWTALGGHPNIEERIHVVNLVQGLRHASPDGPLYGFLNRRATRICVSGEVAEALEKTGICNGPIHVIPNGIDFGSLPDSGVPCDYDIFIGGLKQPELAAELGVRLQGKGYTVDCQTRQIQRPEFLSRMARAKIVVLLPYEEEGFYLPALEAMAMGKIVICPDCGGNRSFCIGGVTSLTPPFQPDALEEAVAEVSRNPLLARNLSARARAFTFRHDLRTERDTFLNILQQME